MLLDIFFQLSLPLTDFYLKINNIFSDLYNITTIKKYSRF